MTTRSVYHDFTRASLFYVHTGLTPQQAYATVLEAMDATDKLAVINASGGIVTGWDRPPIDAINTIWFAA